MFYLLHFWLSTLHSMKFHYNSKVRIYHCSTCIKHIYLYQNCIVLCWFKSAQHCLHNSVKDRCTQYICGAMICSYFGITFVLLFKKIENAVYTCFQNSMLLFINGFIFDIMNIQNNQSLEFEWVPMLAPFIRSVNDWRFPWLRMFSLSLSKIGWILFNNAKETLQMMLARKCSYWYRGKP